MKSTRCNHRNFACALLASLCAHVVLALLLPSYQSKSLPNALSAEMVWQNPTPKISLQEPKAPIKEIPKTKKPIPLSTKRGPLDSERGTKSEEMHAGSDAQDLGDNRGQGSFIKRAWPLLTNGDSLQVPYPPKARHLRIEGSVRMRLTVAQNGHVIKAEILSGPAHELKQAALRIARKMLFLPATDEDGQARIAEIEHEVIFRLHERS